MFLLQVNEWTIIRSFFKYRTAGVREYWIIDAVKNQIFVYNFEKGEAEQYALQDSVKAGIYENLVIDFSKLDI